jgi:hypothetical protein
LDLNGKINIIFTLVYVLDVDHHQRFLINYLAICWILQNNYYMKHVLRLLDDFVVIDEPSFNAEITMQRLLNVFGKLNIPLALHKSVEPTTSLEYLGIILDSENMIAKLPQAKLCRIKDLLYVFLQF